MYVLSAVISLKFNGGDILRIDLDFERACALFERALAHKKLMTIIGPDGYKLAVNPQTVQFVDNGRGRRIYCGPGEQLASTSVGMMRGAGETSTLLRHHARAGLTKLTLSSATLLAHDCRLLLTAKVMPASIHNRAFTRERGYALTHSNIDVDGIGGEHPMSAAALPEVALASPRKDDPPGVYYTRWQPQKS